jgi:hypothetical protein
MSGTAAVSCAVSSKHAVTESIVLSELGENESWAFNCTQVHTVSDFRNPSHNALSHVTVLLYRGDSRAPSIITTAPAAYSRRPPFPTAPCDK